MKTMLISPINITIRIKSTDELRDILKLVDDLQENSNNDLNFSIEVNELGG